MVWRESNSPKPGLDWPTSSTLLIRPQSLTAIVPKALSHAVKYIPDRELQGAEGKK